MGRWNELIWQSVALFRELIATLNQAKLFNRETGKGVIFIGLQDNVIKWNECDKMGDL